MADFKPMIRLPDTFKLAILAMVLTGAGPRPGVYRITQGDVTFMATGKPGFLRINGKGAKPAGSFTVDAKNGLVSGEVTVKLDDFATGISLRDRHMKEKYLETAKYPEGKFVANTLSLAGVHAESKNSGFALPGTLTIHGKSRPATADTKIKAVAGTIEVRSSLETTLSDFDIAVPEYAGVKVADKVKVEISFTATDDTDDGKKK